MDLFTYLMAKNGNNTSVHGDLFSYLLGKGQSQTYTVSGVTIYIPNAKKLVSFMMTKESTQDGEPSPDNPIEVKTVKGYRNLFDKDNLVVVQNRIYNDSGQLVYAGSSGTTQMYVAVKPNTTYTISGFLKTNDNQRIISFDANKNFLNRNIIFSNDNYYTFTTGNNTYFIDFQYILSGTDFNNYQIVEGNQVLPYVPYGNNYIAVNISDGTNTNKYPIPLNNNEIVGIGDYKDELLVDKEGHCWLNKLIGKYNFTGDESWFTEGSGAPYSLNVPFNTANFCTSNNEAPNVLCNNFIPISYNSNWKNYSNLVSSPANSKKLKIRYTGVSNLEEFKSMLQTKYNNSNPVLLYYPLETPDPIDLNTTVDIRLFKGVNNISNSEDGYMIIEYR